jgi:periplasmic protein CpxP/Spy
MDPMKTWIKRSLIAVGVSTVLLGTLAACGSHHSRGPWSDAQITEMRGKAIERISRKLDLTAAQKPKLEALADALMAQRQALRSSPGGTAGAEPRGELKALIAGSTFDRSKAQALLQGKTAAVQAQGPKVVDAMADFYDSLTPAQQAQVREMMDKRGGRGWMGG